MKKILIILIILNVCLSAQDKSILSGKYSKEQLKEILIPRADWKPFPKISEWNNISESSKQSIINDAEEYLDYEWRTLSATNTLLFVRNGNRDIYEEIYFDKRTALSTLAVAEMLENNGRFTDQIINGIWNICEESTWALPAHFKHSIEYDGLPDVDAPLVDLFAAATSGMLSWIDYFLGEKLDNISPLIRTRLQNEIEKRILVPALNHDYFWKKVSFNWNPWICSNWLASALLMERNEEKRLEAVENILWSLDNFLTPYPDDGGCDEGPGYWGAAGLSLFESIEMLNMATNNKFEIWNNPKLKNIGQYIYKAQLSKDYYINFSDASAKIAPSGAMSYFIGNRINDEKMMKFGAYYYKDDSIEIPKSQFTRTFLQLFSTKGIEETEKKLPLLRDVWFPDIKIMVTRDKEGTDNGFALAAEANHNQMAHNHNDVGSFMIYYNNKPVLIDVGSGTYTAKTFNDERYTLWQNKSEYHNAPTINGFDQPPGINYKADDVVFKSNDEFANLTFELKNVYPDEAGINKWQRSIQLNRTKNVSISDEFDLKTKSNIVENLMTVYKPDVSSPGIIRLNVQEESINITYDSDIIKASVEKKSLNEPEDVKIKRNWGEDIYRIQLSLIEPSEIGKIIFMIRNEN